MTLGACRQAGFEPRMSYATDRIETNLGLVAAGLGVSLLPAPIRNLRRTGVVYRPLAPPAPHVEMADAYPRDTASPSVATFIRVLREATGRTSRAHAGKAANEVAHGDPPGPASSLFDGGDVPFAVDLRVAEAAVSRVAGSWAAFS